MNWRQFLSQAAIVGAIEFAGARAPRAADGPDAIVIDYAYYNPVSLLLRKRDGWIWNSPRKAWRALGAEPRIKQGAGVPARRLERFGSSAGAAAIVAPRADCRSGRFTSTRSPNGRRS